MVQGNESGKELGGLLSSAENGSGNFDDHKCRVDTHAPRCYSYWWHMLESFVRITLCSGCDEASHA